MLALVRLHDAAQTLLEHDADERRRRRVTFCELAGDYLEWLEHVKGAKPSTLRDHRFLLAEPDQAYRRGRGTSRGHVMSALGDRPAREVTPREVEDLLRAISSTGVAPRTVNKVRQLVCAIFKYGARPSTYALPTNPAAHADRRAELERGPLALYSPQQVEVLARSLTTGAHRDPSRPALSDDEIAARRREAFQDAELVRVAAYAGLRVANSSPCAGVTSTSQGERSSSAGHRRATSSSAPRRAVEPARFRFPIRPPLRLTASPAGTSSPVPTTTSSSIASGAGSIRRRCGAVSSARETQLALHRFASTTFATPAARCSSPEVLTW
jgi:hypothetical protein